MILQFGDVPNYFRMHQAADELLKGKWVTFNVVPRLPLHVYYNWLRRILYERFCSDDEIMKFMSRVIIVEESQCHQS